MKKILDVLKGLASNKKIQTTLTGARYATSVLTLGLLIGFVYKDL